MTRLLTCGWETNDQAENQSLSDSGWTCGNSAPAPQAPSAYYLKNTAGNVAKQWILPAAKTDLYVRFRLYIPAGSVPGIFFYWYDSAGSTQTWAQWTNTSKFLSVGANTTVGTSAVVCDVNIWHLIEFRWQASSASSGIMQVWQDGALVINVSGVDNTYTANANVQRVLFYVSGVNTLYFDDLAVNDTLGTINNGQIGDGAVVLLKPNGAGSNTVLVRGGTNTGANWSQCSELPPSVAQYVSSSTAGDRDTYALEDIPSGSWTVNCVEELVMAQNDVSGAGSLGLTIKSGATTNEGTAQALTTTAAYYRQLYETDPATSAAWTNAAVNALEAGATVR